MTNKRICSWYVDGDFIFLRYMYHRGAFIEDIVEKIVFCKTEDNGIEHVINNYIKFKKVRVELIDKLIKLDNNTKNKTLLEIIEYYYSKKLSESKSEKKNYNNGIKLIKEFIQNMYYTYGKGFNKKDN